MRKKSTGTGRKQESSGRSKKTNGKKSARFQRTSRAVEYIGTLAMTREGFGFVVVKPTAETGPIEDIFVPARKLAGALNGDTVRVAVIPRKVAPGRSVEGEIFHVVERSRRPYVGILQVVNHQAFVITDNKNMPFDIAVDSRNLKGAKSGEKVAVLVTEWNRKGNYPEGEIVDVLGLPGENNTEMHAILAEFGLPYRFDDEVTAEAERMQETISEEEIRERKDFREVPTFTIDPADAKDFDDALSIRKTGRGGKYWEVGVHIADVSFYVKEGSLIDKEAYVRGNSVYLVDRTVPMLPEKLSNQLCSLRPNEVKRCYSAVFELDEKAHIRSQWFGRTLICSQSRLSYQEAQSVLDNGQGVSAESGPVPQAICDGLQQLRLLAEKLRSERFRQGAIAFERPEVKVEVDEQGRPLGVHVRKTLEANSLIEEFMLLANKGVAELIGKKAAGSTSAAKTFVYRVHDAPAEDKIAAFQGFVHHFGFSMNASKSTHDFAVNLNALLESIKDKPQADGIVIMALRSMARAHYTTHNVGHYGLAFDYYTHFTSPIRRYADLLVHRLLTLYLNGEKSVPEEVYEAQCSHISQREQLATEAERASVKYKMVEFMQDKVGKVFTGTVSGLTEWGMYVELDETQIEGMISLREMDDDYYMFDKETYTLTGKHSHRHYVLGSHVKIRVERANLEQKQLDYKLINE